MILPNFVVFEGIDGAGTTSQLKLLEELFSKNASRTVHFTAEPTSKETGLFLRRVLKGEFSLHPDTIARLFAADRAEHLYGKDGIVQKTQNKELVICDRYIFSNIAYQMNQCGKTLPTELNKDFPLPEIVFYFSIDPSVSINRIQGRTVTEIYEKKDFLQKTSCNYDEIVKDYANATTIVQIDASKSIEEIHAKIVSVLKAHYSEFF